MDDVGKVCVAVVLSYAHCRVSVCGNYVEVAIGNETNVVDGAPENRILPYVNPSFIACVVHMRSVKNIDLMGGRYSNGLGGE